MIALTPWVTRLLIANVVMYFASRAVPELYNQLAFVPALALVRPWTAFTYMFLHADGWHLLVNMIGLFFFGPRLELRLGSKGFLWLYFLSGFGGAAFSFLFEPSAAVIGASGAVFGVLLGFSYIWPRDLIYIWGVLPVQAWVLTTFLIFISLWSGITGSGAGVAHFAHLGGLAFGYLYLWGAERRRKARVKPFQAPAQQQGPRFQSTAAREKSAVERWRSIEREGLHQLNREEIDQLLDKISTEGIASLTADERAFLDRMANSTGGAAD